MWIMEPMRIQQPNKRLSLPGRNPGFILRPFKIKQIGVVTTEFIFSFLIATGMSVVLFSLNYTLFVVEVTQYVAFATARAHMAGHENPDRQMEAGRLKYAELIDQNTPIGQFYTSEWFSIGGPSEIIFRQGESGSVTGNSKTFANELDGGGEDPHSRFLGVSMALTPKILNFKIAGLGSSNPEEDGSVFQTRINALLIREPSYSECRAFFETRKGLNHWENLISNPGTPIKQDKFVIVEDNGC